MGDRRRLACCICMSRGGRSLHWVTMSDDLTTRQLLGAELWEIGGAPGTARFVAGRENGTPFCAVVCSTDLGLAFCRACPTDVATRALMNRRATSGRCPAGVRLLAFPAPARSSERV